MSRDARVTPEAVFLAADRLVERGATPSLRAVRREIGGGSFGSILPLLQSWRRARGEDPSDPPEGDADLTALPPAVASALDRLMTATAEVAEAVRQSGAAPDGVDIPRPGQRSPSIAIPEPTVPAASLAIAIPTPTPAAPAQDPALRGEIETLRRLAAEKIGRLQAERDALAREVEALKGWQSRAAQHIKVLAERLGDSHPA